jgi:hypothetical protein
MPHFEKLRKMERDVGALGTIGFLFDRGGARNGQSRPCGNRGPSMNCSSLIFRVEVNAPANW